MAADSERPTVATVTDWNALRERPFDLLIALEQRLRHTRMDISAGETASWAGLAFRLGGLWFAAPRDDVREVSILPRLTRVPGAKPWLVGVANVRGNLLPVTDLAQLLGVSRPEESRAQRVLVLNAEGLPAGFLVDEVAGYRQFAPGDQRHELLAASGTLQPYLLGGFRREGRDWLALSLRRVARSDAFTHAAA